MSLQELKKYTFRAKYSSYNKDKKRRETWTECVSRSETMMLKKYADKNIDDIIRNAYAAAKRKEVLGAQRALQFAGPAIEVKNARLYNCSSTYADRPRFFQEAMYLLLCGCGVGFSVQQHHVAKLPKLVKGLEGRAKYVIPDTIEGWSDAIGILINSYLKGGIYSDYEGKVVDFDYSKIRPAGAKLSYTTGKAPGPEPLKNAISKIRKLLNEAISNGQKQLKPIQVYDIVMHSSDAVLAGGVRRSATICLFSPEDNEMLTAKTGNWFNENPQRGRSNNSVVLLRGSTTKEKFDEIIQNVKDCGEPGFVWVDSLESNFNPCQPESATVLTPNGIRQFKDINVGSMIWSETGWVKVIKKWSTGRKKVFKYETNAGFFLGTENHRLISNGNKIEAKDCETVDILRGDSNYKVVSYSPQSILDGLVLGDGTKHSASNDLIGLLIGQNDQDYFNSEIKDLILKHRPGICDSFYEVNTTINSTELVKTYERRIPDRFLYGDSAKLCSFLRGLYSANGSVINSRVTFKTASSQLREDIQLALSSLGIASYYTTNKPTQVEFENGTYDCKESYDINISVDVDKFASSIGFIQNYKTEKLNKLLGKNHTKGKTSYDVTNIKFIGEEEVYDITVDNEPHTYWTGGLNVSNCVEINFWCYDIVDKNKFEKWQKENGHVKVECQPEEIGLVSGWEFCNLSTINGAKAKTKELFLAACHEAAVIGTLQAGFTDFPYLGVHTENIVRREALLGVSITGVMENPDICLNAEIQREGAALILKVNEEIAKLLGINPAARATCIKPEGTTSCILGTSSGIHPHHARRYFRLIQATKLEPLYQYFNKINPEACENSVWSANDSDDVISFCVSVPDGAKTKNQLKAVDLLAHVKETQKNWVTYGRVTDRCTQPWLNHNVSNTITIRPTEWEEVRDFIYDNREFFCGISLLPESGDKDYPQAPFTTVYTPKEMVGHYGDGAMFVSGLIETSLELYDDNLWQACDVLNGINGKITGKAKKDWFKRCQAFADKYLAGDLKKFTYLMKDVYNWKKWLDLNRTYKDVDYDLFIEQEEDVNISHSADSACSGGSCSIIRT